MTVTNRNTTSPQGAYLFYFRVWVVKEIATGVGLENTCYLKTLSRWT